MLNYNYIKDEITQALLSDQILKFKRVGNDLRDGVCPSCGQKELFVKLDKPFRVQCRRYDNCNYSESTRSLYPDIFENLSKKYPATEKDPNASANAYMSINRHFDLKVVKSMYHQAVIKTKSGAFAETVRFPLWGNHYWDRIIDAEKVRGNEGKKVKISYKSNFQGTGWVPPGTTFEKNDIVYITEGIFKSLAFLHFTDEKYKTIAAISCSNLPRNIIKENKGKDITWILANDNDNAGQIYARKYKKEIEGMGEKCLVAFPEVGKDWDDEHRNGRLNQKYLEESIWRGYYLMADNAQTRAFYHWCKFRYYFHVYQFNNALYRYKIDHSKNDEEIEDLKTHISKWSSFNNGLLAAYISKFSGFCQTERISNCSPSFQYIEKDVLTDDQYYNFKFDFSSGNPSLNITLEGGALESASSFNKALLTKTPGGTFDGTVKDLKRLRDFWFNKKISYIKTVPFIGYDKDSQVYIFPEFAFHKGKFLDINNQGFISAGKERIKSGFRSVHIHKPEKGDITWINDYIGAFQMNGLVLMSWWLGSLFSEQIRAKLQSWPFLEYTGDQGAGKSTQIEFMWKCCGRDNYEGFDPSKSTYVGRARNFQQLANLPVVLLEGDRGDSGAKKRSFDMDELKTAFNGRGIRAMGVKKRGAETEEPAFRGSVLVSQNAEVDGSDALLSRIVHCHCTRSHFTDKTEIKARRLSSLTQKDCSAFLYHALKNEDLLLKRYLKKFFELEKKFKARSKAIQNRLILNHAQVAAWAHQLPLIFGDRISNQLCLDVEDYIWTRCSKRQRRLLADHPLVQLFWEYYYDLNEKRTGTDGVQELLNHSKDSSEIAINLTQFQEVINSHNLERISTTDLKKLLPLCRSHRFICQKTTRSQIYNTSKYCWIFENSRNREV